MIKHLLILVIFLFGFNILKGNTNGSIHFFEKYQKATIHFLDGTSVKGYGKIVDFLKVYKIKFKASLDDKPDVWTDLMVKGITFHDKYEDFVFQYVKTHYNTSPRLLEVLEKGTISIYVEISSSWVTNGLQYGVGFDNKTGFPNNFKHKETFYKYFIKKEQDPVAIDFSGVINFKRRASKYFIDCDGIVNRINSKEYNRNTIPEMVYYYNDFCAD